MAKKNVVNRNGNIEFWIGSNCTDPNLRAGRCLKVGTALQTAFLNDGHATVTTNARIMSTETSVSGAVNDAGVPINNGVFPPTGNPTCTLNAASGSMGIFLIVDTNGDGYADASDSSSVYLDLQAPPSPDSEGIKVQGGDQALVVSWPKIDTSLYTDLLGYQILCNRGGSLKVFPDGSFDPGFSSCPATSMVGGIETLNPLFVCSPLLSPSTSSYRVKILQNDIVYGAAVVSVDQSTNASTPDIFYGAPVKTKSFYEVYRNGHEGAMEPDSPPGSATGGFCAVAEPEPSGRMIWLWVVGLAVTGLLVVARRRGRP